MVSDTRASAESPTDEISAAEFGLISTQYFQEFKNYHGKLYRMSSDLQKSISEITGFSAKFDLSSIRTAFMDLANRQGHITVEIERNTKPGDINVRYARDRWSIQEVSGKTAEGLRPWIKSEYHAKKVDESACAAIAELLGISLSQMDNFILRFNFRERTFGIIAAEEHIDTLPQNAFTSFDISITQAEAVEDAAEANDEDHLSDESHDSTASGEKRNMESTFNTENDQMAAEKQPAATEVRNELSNEQPAAQPAEQPTAQTVELPAAQPPVEAAPVAAADAVPATPAETPKQDSFFTKQPAPKQNTQETAQEQPRRATVTTERSSRNERSSYGGNNPTPSVRREITPEPKYATYSQSEIDYMFKQQAESILQTLSSKVAAQQRGFQEAITSQEKAFNRIAENFTTQFDEARIKLETTTRNSQEVTHRELEEFHKQLTKELESYRTQINKVVVPVAKALEDPSKFKQQKEQTKAEPTIKGAAAANIAALEKRLQMAIVAAVASAVIALGFGVLNLLSIAEVKALHTAAQTNASGTTPETPPTDK